MENERVWKRLRTKGGCKRVGTLEDRGSWLTITPLPPLFFVSVASKGLSSAVSLLFATLAGKSISVAAKGFKRVDCWREGNCVGWKDSEEVRRTTWRAGMDGRRRRILPT